MQVPPRLTIDFRDSGFLLTFAAGVEWDSGVCTVHICGRTQVLLYLRNCMHIVMESINGSRSSSMYKSLDPFIDYTSR
jgi:hypothetical protein